MFGVGATDDPNQKKNGKVSEFKENMGAIPWATFVLAISATCIHQVYDDKK